MDEQRRTSKTWLMYLNWPTRNSGFSNEWMHFMKPIHSGPHWKDEPMMRMDMIVPASSSVRLPPSLFAMTGAPNRNTASKNVWIAPRRPNQRLPSASDANCCTKYTPNCWSYTPPTAAPM